MEEKMKKVRFALYLDPRQIEQLEEASERTGAPVAELIRRAVATQYPYPSQKSTLEADVKTAVEMHRKGIRGPQRKKSLSK
jgi:Ribbon-helix-helix domain